MKQFSKISDLVLNLSKCEVFVLKGAVNPADCIISEKDTVTYLGIKITKNLKAVNVLNLNPVTESVNNTNILMVREGFEFILLIFYFTFI